MTEGTDRDLHKNHYIERASAHLRDLHEAPNPRQKRDLRDKLAAEVVELRKLCCTQSGHSDLRGQSAEYKNAMKQIRERASDSGESLVVPKQVAHKVNELLLNDPDLSRGVLESYGFDCAPAHQRAHDKWVAKRSRTRALSWSAAEEDTPAAFVGRLVEQLEQEPLAELTGASDEDRDRTREMLLTLSSLAAERADEIGTVY